MALGDLVLKAKVNMALSREPRLINQHIDVEAENGIVTLSGDTDKPETAQAAVASARQVEGVTQVQNALTHGKSSAAASADEVIARFLGKLDSEWQQLPANNTLAQADYVRWSLWMITKFHIPANVEAGVTPQQMHDTAERALDLISEKVGVSKTLLALELLRQAEEAANSPWRSAPHTETPSLSTSPVAFADAPEASNHDSRQMVTA